MVTVLTDLLMIWRENLCTENCGVLLEDTFHEVSR